MANGMIANQSMSFGGLGTQSFTVATAGIYSLEVSASIPYIASGSSNKSDVTTGSSGLSIALKQGSTTLLTVSAPSINQPFMYGKVKMLALAGDVITVVLTSSAAADQLANAIKGTINLYQGV